MSLSDSLSFARFRTIVCAFFQCSRCGKKIRLEGFAGKSFKPDFKMLENPGGFSSSLSSSTLHLIPNQGDYDLYYVLIAIFTICGHR
jgi:hypothetical protein